MISFEYLNVLIQVTKCENITYEHNKFHEYFRKFPRKRGSFKVWTKIKISK